MSLDRFSRTTSLLLVATLALAMAHTVSAELITTNPADAEWLNDGKNDGLQLVTFFSSSLDTSRWVLRSSSLWPSVTMWHHNTAQQ